MNSPVGVQAAANATHIDIGGPSVVNYSRDFIADDKATAPYLLTGVRRTVCLAVYVSIVCAAFSGALYSLYVDPVFVLAVLPVCYAINNVTFLTVHCKLHASFIDLREEEMGVICHNSFIHHYRNIKVYHEKWVNIPRQSRGH